MRYLIQIEMDDQFVKTLGEHVMVRELSKKLSAVARGKEPSVDFEHTLATLVSLICAEKGTAEIPVLERQDGLFLHGKFISLTEPKKETPDDVFLVNNG